MQAALFFKPHNIYCGTHVVDELKGYNMVTFFNALIALLAAANKNYVTRQTCARFIYLYLSISVCIDSLYKMEAL